METSIEMITKFYQKYPEYIGKIDVESRFGYYPILASEITAYNSDVYRLVTETGKELKCSPKHRLFNGDWVHCEKLSVGNFILTSDGYEKVISIDLLDYKDDLYDIQVKDVEEYYSNDIVSHNSSIVDSLVFVLFGKPFRDIKKDLLVNSTNKKNCLVSCELIGKDGNEYLINRGIKPNLLEIYRNGEVVEMQAELKDIQEHLEKYVLGFDYNTFTQTVIISKTKYTPFMRLKTAERRTFVEKLLNIEVLGLMANLQKENVSNAKSELSLVKSDLDSLIAIEKVELNSIDRLKSIIDDVRERQKQSFDNELKSIDNEIISIANEVNSLSEQLRSITIDNDIIDKFNKLEKAKTANKVKISTEEQNIIKYRKTDDKCPMCNSPIDISHIQGHIQECEKNINEFKDKLEKIDVVIEKLRPKVAEQKENTQRINDINREISLKKSMIENLKRKRKEIEKNQSENLDIKGYEEEIKNAVANHESTKEKIANLSKDVTIYTEKLDFEMFITNMLKDSGIKASIISKSINIINSIINEYLLRFGFIIDFNLDSEFNETIKIKGNDKLTYHNFSEGEKLRVDLALLLAWREIAIYQANAKCNVLFFDEITDASLDSDGVDLLANVLNNLKDTNVFIITHTPEKLESHARGFITLDKSDGFTKIVVNK